MRAPLRKDSVILCQTKAFARFRQPRLVFPKTHRIPKHWNGFGAVMSEPFCSVLDNSKTHTTSGQNQ